VQGRAPDFLVILLSRGEAAVAEEEAPILKRQRDVEIDVARSAYDDLVERGRVPGERLTKLSLALELAVDPRRRRQDRRASGASVAGPELKWDHGRRRQRDVGDQRREGRVQRVAALRI